MTLRTRVLLLVAAINVAIFGAGLAWLAPALAREQVRAANERLRSTVELFVEPAGRLRVAEILAWPSWELFDDAVLVGVDEEAIRLRGEVVPRGPFLNPVGAARRPADFDLDGVLADIGRAVLEEQPVEAEVGGRSGLAVPIHRPGGAVWGGCWFAFDASVDRTGLVLQLLPWFLSSTLLLTLGTFFVLRRFVLDPVRELAVGARRVAAGDLSVRLAEPARHDEMADLIRGFNQMTATVEGFNARLAREVESATRQARIAGAAAMTQRRLAATGELAAGIAHEINNPLGGLINAVERLESGRLDERKRAQYLELLRGGLERIRGTVGQLLRFTPRAAARAPVPLGEPVLDALGLVRHRARQQGVVLLVAAGSGAPAPVEDERAVEGVRAAWARLPAIHGERNELGQAVLNLLVNALDALEGRASGAGHVEVRLARVDAAARAVLELVVADDGPGVDAAELARVADLYYTTKEVGRGTGLGLAIVHRVAASHGGRVRLSSAPGEGFRVELRLPVDGGGERGPTDRGPTERGTGERGAGGAEAGAAPGEGGR